MDQHVWTWLQSPTWWFYTWCCDRYSITERAQTCTSITTLTWVAIRERERERHKDTKRPRETTLLSEHHYNTARRIDDSCKLKHYKLFCFLFFERYTVLMHTLRTLWMLSCALESYSCFIASFSSRYCRLLATGSRPTQRLRHQQLLPQIYRIAASSATFKASGMLDSVGSCWLHRCPAS